MSLKYSCKVLLLGLLIDWWLNLLVVSYLSLNNNDLHMAVWLNLLIVVYVLLYMRSVSRTEDSSVLVNREHSLLIANMIAVAFALFVGALTFSNDWLATDVRYISLAFGLPSLGAIIYWRIYKANQPGLY